MKLAFISAALALVAARDGVIAPVSFMQTKNQILPSSTSNFHNAMSYPLPKYTPGDACGTHTNCKECLINQVCVWLPFGNKCVEDRNPEHATGTMLCNTWTPDLLPVVTNEHDDYRLFHTRNDPRDFNIASLGGGQDVYGLATDLESSRAYEIEDRLAINGGGEIVDGLTHKSYEGQLLEHDWTGKMLPVGQKGRESKEACPCSNGPVKFAAKGCDCGYPEFIPNAQYN